MQVKNKKVYLRNLGNIDYKEAWDLQTELFEQVISIKVGNRDATPEEIRPTSNYLLVCQHPHVFTLGKSGKGSHLLLNSELLKIKGASYYEINRGGDITYHGPGQIVVYPILDLDNFFTDIHKYLRYLEEAVIRTLAEYGILSGRVEGMTGVWIDGDEEKKARKICALGVKTSRWVSMHGLGFNVNTDLEYFNYIIPCGIPDRAVTSLEKELGKKVAIPEVEEKLVKHLTELFEMEIENLNA